MNVEDEIVDLKRRVGDLEGAVSVLTGQLRVVHPEIVALRESTGKHLDGVAAAVGAVERRMVALETQVWSLRDDLPALIRSGLAAATDPKREPE